MRNKIHACLARSLTISLLLMIFTPQIASAWEPTDVNWRYSRISLKYTNAAPAWQTAIHNARSTWNGIGGGNVRIGLYIDYIPPTPPTPNVPFNFDIQNFSRDEFLGQTFIRHIWIGDIQTLWAEATTISLDEYWRGYYQVPGDPNSGQWDGQSTVAHELGHVVGLFHTQNTYGDATMWEPPRPEDYLTLFLGNTDRRTLTADDTTGAHAIYPGFYRLYKGGDHMYTTKLDERNNLMNAGWSDEGPAGWAWGFSPGGTTSPIFRLYNGFDHMYTASTAEYNNLKNAGWSDEGIEGYCLLGPAADAVPLYRMYGGGDHLYTINFAEVNYLFTRGWRFEGVACYVRNRNPH